MAEIKSANAWHSGGGIFVYIGELTDGTWFMSGDLSGNTVTIVDDDPNNDDAWYLDWQQAHLVRNVSGQDGTALLISIMQKLLEEIDTGVPTWCSNDRDEILLRLNMLNMGEQI